MGSFGVRGECVRYGGAKMIASTSGSRLTFILRQNPIARRCMVLNTFSPVFVGFFGTMKSTRLLILCENIVTLCDDVEERSVFYGG